MEVNFPFGVEDAHAGVAQKHDVKFRHTFRHTFRSRRFSESPIGIMRKRFANRYPDRNYEQRSAFIRLFSEEMQKIYWR